MKLRFYARIIIERPEGEAERRRIPVKAAKKWRPADAAETSMVTRRGLVIGNEFFTLDPAEIFGVNARATAKSRPMRLSTHGAVAIQRAGEWAINLVSHTTA